VLEKFEQFAGLCGACTEMHIGDEDCSHVPAKAQSGSPRSIHGR
jgi:hypothetical protein